MRKNVQSNTPVIEKPVYSLIDADVVGPETPGWKERNLGPGRKGRTRALMLIADGKLGRVE